MTPVTQTVCWNKINPNLVSLQRLLCHPCLVILRHSLPARLQPRCSHGWELQIKEEHTFRGPTGLGGNEFTRDLSKNPAKVNGAPSHRACQGKSRNKINTWEKRCVFRVSVCNSHSCSFSFKACHTHLNSGQQLKEPNAGTRTYSCLLGLKMDPNAWETVMKHLCKCIYFTFTQAIRCRLACGRMHNARWVMISAGSGTSGSV